MTERAVYEVVLVFPTQDRPGQAHLSACGVQRLADRLRFSLYSNSRTASYLEPGRPFSIQFLSFQQIDALIYAAFNSLAERMSITMPEPLACPELAWWEGTPYLPCAPISLLCTVESMHRRKGADGLGPFLKYVYTSTVKKVLACRDAPLINRAWSALLEASIQASRISYATCEKRTRYRDRALAQIQKAKSLGDVQAYLISDALEELVEELYEQPPPG